MDHMKQIMQSYRKGDLRIVDVPVHEAKPGHVLVKTMASMVSVGTEKYMLEMGRKSLAGKAMARPDLVRQVIAKAQAEGIMEAWRQAVGRLDTPVPLGYSSSGVVIDVGAGVEGFAVGDRVACTGAGFAGHTEVASVPTNLCVPIPPEVDFDAAAFVALGGIALQAVRMAQVSFGESVVVIGLGLLGQVAVQLLAAAGCHVIGMDLDAEKAALAEELGAEAVVSDYAALSATVHQMTAGLGVDAVIILAATTSNQPLEQAAHNCRERGRVVAAGLVGLEIPRTLFYDKELDFVVSRGWGPGLYDPDFTDRGAKYPLAYARWTAQRNMAEFLAQAAKGAIRVDPLISHRFPFEQALDAYQMIASGEEPYLGVLLTYEGDPVLERKIVLNESGGHQAARPRTGLAKPVGVGFIGAGLFAQGTLLPAMKGIPGLHHVGVATSSGLSAQHTAKKFGFDYCTTDYQEILNDPQVDLVFVLTQHGSHSSLVSQSLEAGKHVFVEKPLALTVEQLKDVYRQVRQAEDAVLMVGFNRRFSSFTVWQKGHFSEVAEPLSVVCTVNAGMVPADHWVRDPIAGGGRIIGEVCHFVDLIQFLTGSLPVRVFAETFGAGAYKICDNVTITLKMADGSLGTINYVSGGDKRHPRERVEIIGGGGVGVIDNFQAARITRGGRVKRKRNWLSVDRGHNGEIRALVDSIRNGDHPPVAFEEYLCTTLATFAIEESLKTGQAVDIDIISLEGGE